MEDGGCQNGLNSVADTVTEINEVTKSSLTFIDGDDMCLHRDGTNDNGKKKILGS
jgi:hypothetical protein